MHDTDFCFGDIASTFLPLLPLGNGRDRTGCSNEKKFLKALFAFPGFSDYCAVFFSSDYLPLARKRLRKFKPPECKINFHGIDSWSLHWQFKRFSTGLRNKVRPKGTYPLTKEEMRLARKFIKENPEYHVAMAAFQACIVSYLCGIRSALREYDEEQHCFDHQAREVLEEQIRNANIFSFLHDLSPIMAFAYSTKQPGDGPQDLLRDVFKRQAFQSMRRGERVRCPFARAFGRVFSLELKHGPDNAIVHEEGQFGDVLNFLMGDIRQRLTQEDLERVADNYEY